MSENGLLGLLNGAEMNIEQKIVEELLNNKNLETKTDLSKPMLWSCLTMIESYLKNKNLPNSALLIQNFIQSTFKYLISKDRKGRLEYLEALKGLKDRIQQTNPIAMSNQIGKGGV